MPDGLESYRTRVASRNQDGSDLFVDVDASFNQNTGLLTWIFRSLDPLTGFLPQGVFDGFLPVNDETHRGEGFVRYLVRPKASLANGTTIDQQASIVFDVNTPIETNVLTNTIDAGTTTSSVNPLPTTVLTAEFPVTWSGSDGAGELVGSGIASYDIFVSDNGGPYQSWLTQTASTSATFTGQLNHQYGFYSVARDNVGLVEVVPNVADTMTTFNTNHAPTVTNPLANQFTLGSVTLQGNGGDDVLIGGSKNDSLNGGTGRDLLIGGAGGDAINGGADEDLLIGGTTTASGGTAANVADLAALSAIMAEWTRTGANSAYLVRIANLLNGVGPNSTKLNSTTVQNDSSTADNLNGSLVALDNTDLDWFFKSSGDVLDAINGETVTTVL